MTAFTAVSYQEIKAEASSTATENIGNIKTVKAFSGEKIGAQEFEKHNAGALNIGKSMAYYYAFMMMSMQIFFNGSFIGIMYIASREIKNGDLTTGETAAYMLYNW